MTKHTIECPKCHEVFQVDEAGYAAIVKQVRDEEFSQEQIAEMLSKTNETSSKYIKEYLTNIDSPINSSVERLMSELVSSGISQSDETNFLEKYDELSSQISDVFLNSQNENVLKSALEILISNS